MSRGRALNAAYLILANRNPVDLKLGKTKAVDSTGGGGTRYNIIAIPE